MLRLNAPQHLTYAAAYGQSVDATTLIPHIVAAFIEKGRAFQRVRKRGVKVG